MWQPFVGIIAVLVLVGPVPVAAGQGNAAVQEKPASSPPQPVTCDALLQHPLAWWLGSLPTAGERDQLAACLAGSRQQAPASPSVSPAPSAAAAGAAGQLEQQTVPPLRGAADVDYFRSPIKREGSTLVTKIQVKNASTAPIQRLTIHEI
jgi:hypothetical protein